MTVSLSELLTRRYDRHALYDRPAWYDFDYIGYDAEADFYHGLLQRCLQPEECFLELGAGSGRLLMDPLSSGINCHAVEPNPHMLQVCQARASAGEGSGRFSSECARADNFEGPPGIAIGLAAFTFNGVLHLHTIEELRRSFRHVAQKLGPGRSFALDLMSPAWELMEAGSMAWGRLDERIDPKNGQSVWTFDRCFFEPDTHLVHSEIRFIRTAERSGTELYYAQRMWTYQEILGALAETGFEVVETYGDVDFSTFDENSPRLLVVAETL